MEEHTLVKIAKNRFANLEETSVHLVDENNINTFLNDLNNYPHAYVLACLMDRQIKSERAWVIPWLIKEELKTFDLDILEKQSLNFYVNLFNEKSLHRFNNDMAKVFYLAIHKIAKDYRGDAAKIWNNKPSSAAVVYRFLQFEGCGIKIATMATNILARQFLIPFSDYYSIDISPDVHIKRVLKRTGLVSKNATNESIIYKARELNPDFPGIIDFSCWEIGRDFCRPKNPNCSECPINKECLKIL